MDIYLIRHGDALPQGAGSIKTDEERPLTDEGWKQATCLGRALKKRGVVLDALLTSPLVRAQQTALQLRNMLELTEAQVETRDELAPGGRPKKLARCLNGMPGNSVGLVGHQPDLSQYAGWMLGEKEVQIHFAKGGAALIRVEGSLVKGAGVLMWLVTPEWVE
jgi:phosphohistidine phosphatase SixA